VPQHNKIETTEMRSSNFVRCTKQSIPYESDVSSTW